MITKLDDPIWCEERISDANGQALESYFKRFYVDLSLAQAAALSIDFGEMTDLEGLGYAEGARELSRRIGGPAALADYADCQVARFRRSEALLAKMRAAVETLRSTPAEVRP